MSRASVYVWLRLYQDQGPEGLKVHLAPGESGQSSQDPDPGLADWMGEERGCSLNRAECAYAFLPVAFIPMRDIMEIEERRRELGYRQGTGLTGLISRFLRARYCYYHTWKYRLLSLIERIGR